MKKVLFVDDEPPVLEGLCRSLRPMRHEWETAFVPSGAAALDALAGAARAGAPFDVIVSDMRMPGMDGIALLSEVVRRHPETVRIALSGHAEMEMALESVKAVHQFLAKPCAPDVLRATVERACGLRELLANEELGALVGRLDSLPSLPSLYVEVMEEIRSPEPALARVAAIVEKDMAMTAKILQVVNSAFFGLRRHVSSPSQAVLLLGLDVIRGLVLSTKVFAQFDPAPPGVDLETMWSRGARTGTLARRIAVSAEQPARIVDYALMAGMLHDVGRLLLALNLPERYAEVLREDGPLAANERAKLGCTHMEVGAYLLGLWGLPDAIVEAVAFHHEPHRAVGDHFGPLAAVHVAQALVEGESVDVEYLERLGVADRVTAWQALYEEHAGVEDDAA